MYWHRSGPHPEDGLSLVELLVGMIVSMIVLYLAYSLFLSATGSAQAITNRAINAANARTALDALEADLRYADYVALSGNGTSTTLTVRNEAASNSTNQPTCAAWTLTSQPANAPANLRPTSWGLVETVSGSPRVVMAGTTVPSGITTPFTMPLPTLVEIDIAVNDETPAKFAAADTVTVHDVVSPDNLHSALANGGSC